MSRTNRFLSGVSFGYAGQFLTTVVALWLTPFTLSRIGQHDYGLWLIGAQLLAYLGLMDFGIVALLPRATAYATGRAGGTTEAKDLSQIIGQTGWLVLCQTPVVAIVAAILWFTIPLEWGSLRVPIAVVMITFVVAFPLRIFAAILQGLQDLGFLGRLNIVCWLSGTALTVILIFGGKGLYALAFGWVTTQLMAATISFIRLRRRFPDVLPRRWPTFSWLETRSGLRQGFWVSLAQLAQVLLNGTDMLIVGALLGPAAVVTFACTGKLINVFSNQPRLLVQTAGPALSEAKTSVSRARLFNISSALTQAILILSGGMVCLLLVINKGFVSRWVGPEQFGGFKLTALLLLTAFLRHWGLSVGYSIFCFGYERRLAITGLLDGVVTVVATIVLVKAFGLIGIPLGSIIGASLVYLPLTVSAQSVEAGVPKLSLFKAQWPLIWRLSLLVTGTGALGLFWSPSTFVEILIVTVALLTGYSIVMFAVVLNPPLRDYVVPRLELVRASLSRFLGLSGPASGSVVQK